MNLDASGTPFRFLAIAALALVLGDPAVHLEVLAPASQADVWPLPCGLEVPEGLLERGERLALFESGGGERAARIDACAANGDGSPRFVRVLCSELPRDVRRLELRSTRLAPPAPRLRCLREGREGKALRFLGEGGGAIEWREGTLALAAEDARLEIEFPKLGLALDGDERRARCGAVRVIGPDAAGAEVSIPLRFTIDDFGSDDGDGEAAEVPLEVQLSIASSGCVAELEFAFAAPRDALVRGLSLRGRVTGSLAQLLRGSTKVKVKADKRGTQSALESGLVGDLRQEALADAIAPLALVAGEGRQRVELSWPEFGLARPSGAHLRRDGTFELELVAEPLFVHAGQTLRRTLRLALGDRVGRGGAQSGRGAQASQASRSFRPFIVPRGPSAAPDEASRAWLAPWLEFLESWLARPRRLDDRGCYPESWGALANGEYDLGGSLLWLGTSERDARWLACGTAIARHTVDWDRGVIQEDEDGTASVAIPSQRGSSRPPPPRGLFFQHGDDHASGKVEAGHQWLGGALGLARTSGSLAGLDAARQLTGALALWRSDPGRFHGPERRLAWPLHAAVELDLATGDAGAHRLGDALLRELLGRQHPAGYVDGDRRRSKEGVHVWVNSWVSLGITVDALRRAERAHPGRGAREAALKLARFVVNAALMDEGLAEVLLVDPELSVAFERRGRCNEGDAALAAAGLSWFARESGDAKAAGVAVILRDQARAALAVPREDRLTSLAKMLLALRFEREGGAPAAGGQSLSSPWSVRRPLRDEKR